MPKLVGSFFITMTIISGTVAPVASAHSYLCGTVTSDPACPYALAVDSAGGAMEAKALVLFGASAMSILCYTTDF